MWEQLLKAKKLPSRYYILGHEIDRYKMRLSARDNINLAKKIIEKLHDKLNPNSTRLGVNHTLAFFMPSYFGEYRIIFHLWSLDEKYLEVDVININDTKLASKLARTFSDRHGLKDLIKEFIGIDVNFVA